MPDQNPTPPTLDPLAGKVIEGRWRLISKLGEGGMGSVYLAEQLSIRGRRVAVKLLRAELAQNAEFLRRFRGEAERAAAVSDPRIVMVLDFGQAESGELFLVMEYVVGDTLADVLRAGPLPLERALSFGTQLADALHRVHEVGVIHRDVKPANAMIRQGSDDLKLMDFGIARDVDDLEHTQLTQSGVVVGTPAFMAPEQINGGALSPRTDIYAWGVVMYAMLAGRRPFEASSATAIQYMHVHEPPPPLSGVRPGVPLEVERIVMRALEKNPELRQRTMAEAAAALRAVRLPVPDERAASVPEPDLVAKTAATVAPAVMVPPKSEGTVVPTPAEPRSRRGLVVGGSVAFAAMALAAFFALGSSSLPWPIAPQPTTPTADSAQPNGEAAGDHTAAKVPALQHPAPPSHPAAAPTAAPHEPAEALALSRFFLDRGEYDSAVEELERALRAAPDDADLKQALASAQQAKAAEAAVLGASH